MSDVKRWPGFFEQELGSVRRGADVVLASDYDALKARLAEAEAAAKTWENEGERRSRRYEQAAVRLAEAERFIADAYEWWKEGASWAAEDYRASGLPQRHKALLRAADSAPLDMVPAPDGSRVLCVADSASVNHSRQKPTDLSRMADTGEKHGSNN